MQLVNIICINVFVKSGSMCEEQLVIGAQLCFFWVSLGREGGGQDEERGGG